MILETILAIKDNQFTVDFYFEFMNYMSEKFYNDQDKIKKTAAGFIAHLYNNLDKSKFNEIMAIMKSDPSQHKYLNGGTIGIKEDGSYYDINLD